MGRWLEREMEWMDGWTDGWVGERMDGQINVLAKL